MIFLAACSTIITLTIQLFGNSGSPPKKDLMDFMIKLSNILYVTYDDETSPKMQNSFSDTSVKLFTSFLQSSAYHCCSTFTR